MDDQKKMLRNIRRHGEIAAKRFGLKTTTLHIHPDDETRLIAFANQLNEARGFMNIHLDREKLLRYRQVGFPENLRLPLEEIPFPYFRRPSTTPAKEA